MLKEVAPRLTRVKNDGGERCGKSERGSHSRRELLDVGLRGDRLRRRKQDHQLNQRSQIRASTGARSSSRSPPGARESLMQPVRPREAVESRSRAERQQQNQDQCRDRHTPPVCCPCAIGNRKVVPQWLRRNPCRNPQPQWKTLSPPFLPLSAPRMSSVTDAVYYRRLPITSCEIKSPARQHRPGDISPPYTVSTSE
jgi:hypothetical protein